MSVSRKRPHEEIDQFDELEHPIANACINAAAIVSISKMKKGRHCDYFDGKITDGTTELRMVGFASSQLKKMATCQGQGTTVKFENCEIKPSRQGHQMEVLLKSSTKITESSKVIEIPQHNESCADSPTIHLEELPTVMPYDKVTVDIKVLAVESLSL